MKVLSEKMRFVATGLCFYKLVMYGSPPQEQAREPMMHFLPGPMPNNHQNLTTHKPKPLPSLLQHQAHMLIREPMVILALPNHHIFLSSILPLQMQME